MARRRKKATGVRAEPGADLGPSLRRDRDGHLVAWGGAANVDVESRDDPSVVDHRRIVRGARRRRVLLDLEARGTITKRMLDAADQFLDDCSIAIGGSPGSDVLGMPSLSGPRAGLPERQVAAMTRVNTVRHLLGLHDGTVFWWVVFHNRGISEYETVWRLRNGTATRMLKDALAALDEHYHSARSRVCA